MIVLSRLFNNSCRKKLQNKRMNPKLAVVGRRSLSEKHNRCVIIPPKIGMVAETIERRDNSWFVRTNSVSDLIVRIGKASSFHLHMLPMVSRSGYLNRMAFQSRNGSKSSIQLDNLPGGADAFELIVKFCYGWKIDLTVNNVAPLYCASHFLEMSDEFESANLISRTETFLSFLMLSSWKDTFCVLKSCENFSSSARDLKIQTRCSQAIAWKVCTDLGDDGANWLESWWFEDVSVLRIDHFIEVVESIKKKGIMKAELLGSCITYWTAKWLSRKTLNHQMRKVVIESLIRILPVEEYSLPCNFLLHLLKVGRMMNVDPGLSSRLEERIALMLEQCQPIDLLVKNYGESITLYDVKIIVRAMEACVSTLSSNPSSKLFVIARLLDNFMAMVAKDKQLPPQDFQLLIEALPKNARYSDDNLYRAIDIYLKSHPELTEEEREGVCRGMEYHKLSQEAREHVMKNERVPLNMMTQFILLEQVNMARSMTNSGLDYRRTRAQAVIRVDTEERNGFMSSQREVDMMKLEIERLKVQLSKLQFCNVEIKRMANAGLC